MSLRRFFRDIPYLISQVRFSYFLLLLLIPLGEAHKIFINCDKSYDVYLFLDYELHCQWIARHVADKLQFVIICYCLWVYGKGGRTPGFLGKLFLVIFIYSIIDIFMYFAFFGQSYWAVAYYFISIVVILVNDKKKPKKA